MTDRIRVVELFAGVGGFRLGLEAASDRFQTVWANQWEPGKKDQFAFRCYDAHFGSSGSVNVNDDIAKVKGQVPEHDLLVGGFPCQDYSVAATKAKGIEGKKGVLWWSIHDIIKARHPKFVLLENVDRLTRSPASQRGRDFGIILRCLADEGYAVEWRIVNAADYGLQQRRRRTFIFACREDQRFHEVYSEEPEDIVARDGFFARTFPVTGKIVKSKVGSFTISKKRYPSLVEVSDGFEEDFYRAGVMRGYEVYTREVEPVVPEETRTLREILETGVDERYYDLDIEKWKYMKGAKKALRTRKDGSTYNYTEGAIPFPDILDRPGRTMLTSEGTANRSSHLVEDPETGRYRTITPVECERLNGFPDGWTDTGMTERQRYFTMGNALVVQLVERMAKTLNDYCITE
ncbi:MAG: DNA (cytosine-5-)-methyltransferase [Candidatus Methanomethylophilaceae archaeon]|nr:DNA (cytosine-5-)-methyltransferase [Candidatus Methanomethylophilaceae archaeon]